MLLVLMTSLFLRIVVLRIIFCYEGDDDFSVKIVWETEEMFRFAQYGVNRNSLDKVGIDTVYGYRNQRHEVVLENF